MVVVLGVPTTAVVDALAPCVNSALIVQLPEFPLVVSRPIISTVTRIVLLAIKFITLDELAALPPSDDSLALKEIVPATVCAPVVALAYETVVVDEAVMTYVPL